MEGLPSLGTDRVRLIDSESTEYDTTRQWAEAIHNDNPSLDGLYWISRQNDRCPAILLFGTRVGTRDVAGDPASLALDAGMGFDLVARWADKADITLI